MKPTHDEPAHDDFEWPPPPVKDAHQQLIDPSPVTGFPSEPEDFPSGDRAPSPDSEPTPPGDTDFEWPPLGSLKDQFFDPDGALTVGWDEPDRVPAIPAQVAPARPTVTDEAGSEQPEVARDEPRRMSPAASRHVPPLAGLCFIGLFGVGIFLGARVGANIGRGGIANMSLRDFLGITMVQDPVPDPIESFVTVLPSLRLSDVPSVDTPVVEHFRTPTARIGDQVIAQQEPSNDTRTAVSGDLRITSVLGAYAPPGSPADAPAAGVARTDEELVRDVLRRYADTAAGGGQVVQFARCDLAIAGSDARARCRGRARAAIVQDDATGVEREWTFVLRKSDEGWTIAESDVR